MTPLEVITLDEAKDFLRVDFPDDDEIIEGNIKSAISLIEQKTGYRLWDREEVVTGMGPFNIYVYPFTIDSVIDQQTGDAINLESYQSVELSLRTKVHVYGCKGVKLTLNVGYTDRDQIPADLLDAVKKQVTFIYQNRDNYKADIPSDIYEMIQPFMRFHGF